MQAERANSSEGIWQIESNIELFNLFQDILSRQFPTTRKFRFKWQGFVHTFRYTYSGLEFFDIAPGSYKSLFRLELFFAAIESITKVEPVDTLSFNITSDFLSRKNLILFDSSSNQLAFLAFLEMLPNIRKPNYANTAANLKSIVPIEEMAVCILSLEIHSRDFQVTSNLFDFDHNLINPSSDPFLHSIQVAMESFLLAITCKYFSTPLN